MTQKYVTEELTSEDIAAELGCSEAAARQALVKLGLWEPRNYSGRLQLPESMLMSIADHAQTHAHAMAMLGIRPATYEVVLLRAGVTKEAMEARFRGSTMVSEEAFRGVLERLAVLESRVTDLMMEQDRGGPV